MRRSIAVSAMHVRRVPCPYVPALAQAHFEKGGSEAA